MMPCIVLKIKEETVCVQHRDNAIAHHGLFEPGMTHIRFHYINI